MSQGVIVDPSRRAELEVQQFLLFRIWIQANLCGSTHEFSDMIYLWFAQGKYTVVTVPYIPALKDGG